MTDVSSVPQRVKYLDELSSELNKSQLRQLAEADWVPPDGGWGWMCVFACFTIFALTVGMSRTFGIIYNDVKEAFPEALHIEIAMIPSMVITLIGGLGAISGALIIAYSVRTICFVGGLLAGIGISINFFAVNVYYMQASFLIAGTGAGLACNPSLMIVAKYFSRRRTQAVGIALSGTAVGSIILPPILEFLVYNYGFRGALLILGGLLFNVCVVSLMFRDPLPKKEMRDFQNKLENDMDFRERIMEQYSKRPKTNACFRWTEKYLYLDLTLLYNTKFLIVLLSSFILTIGYPQTLTFVPPHAMHLNYTKIEGGLLVSLASIGDFIGRFINGYIFDRDFIKKPTGYVIATFVLSLSLVGLALFGNYIAMSVCLIFHGYFAGCAIILTPVILSENHGRQKLQSSIGITRTAMGMSCLITPVLAGHLVDVTGNFEASFYTLAGTTVFSGLVMCALILLSWKSKRITNYSNT